MTSSRVPVNTYNPSAIPGGYGTGAAAAAPATGAAAAAAHTGPSYDQWMEEGKWKRQQEWEMMNRQRSEPSMYFGQTGANHTAHHHTGAAAPVATAAAAPAATGAAAPVATGCNCPNHHQPAAYTPLTNAAAPAAATSAAAPAATGAAAPTGNGYTAHGTVSCPGCGHKFVPNKTYSGW